MCAVEEMKQSRGMGGSSGADGFLRGGGEGHGEKTVPQQRPGRGERDMHGPEKR